MNSDYLLGILAIIQHYPIIGLIVLSIVCFLSATLLPIPSELFLLAYLKAFSEYKILGIICASIFNTAGGLVSYYLGIILKNQIANKVIKHKEYNNQSKLNKKNKIKRIAYIYIRKYGSICLIFAWLPIIGDIICLGSGYFKLNIYTSTFYMLIGKSLRYIIVSYFLYS
jgi:membrane protein YqaA with SNARE-associated domain